MSNSSIAKQFIKICEKINTGSLSVKTPEGERLSFGEGTPEAELIIHNWAMVPIIAERGDVGLGETYVSGYWETPDLEKLLTLLLKNENLSQSMSAGAYLQRMIFWATNTIFRRNNRAGSRKNIKNHYDVGNDFYRLWLDDTMTYSSALFDSDENCLEHAQHSKYARLLSLLPRNAESVLEIGCGWGGFAEQAANEGRAVTGVTVSNAQLEYARTRLGTRANLMLQDYRDIKGAFDAIVSIEMIEAVGERYWPQYFQTIKHRLAEGGRAALQAIIVEDHAFDRYRRQSDFIRQYTFPGGMLIPPQAIKSCAERCGLKVDNMHRFGKDYATTLREWRKRFDAAENKIRALGHGDEFLRSWRYYFDFCAAGFSHGKLINVAQISLSHA